MKGRYLIAGPADSQALVAFLSQEGQWLLPMVQLIEQAKIAVDDLVDVMGQATIEAVLQLSARQVAGAKRRGKADHERPVHWYGRQAGRVSLKERQLRVTKPRLRRKRPEPGQMTEVSIPAYEPMRKDSKLADRMLEILLAGVSTRRYQAVLPQMADQVGISKSTVSRETIQAGQRLLKGRGERRFDDKEIFIIYIDGIEFGQHHVIAAIGVDTQGHKHVLGLREGTSENTTVVTALLEQLVGRGVKPERRRLFVIDGSKALRKAINQFYGQDNPVQRCRNHKERNVVGYLPKDQLDQARSAMKAAWKLGSEEGQKKLQQLAKWYERERPSAASSLREGLSEMFTMNRLNLPATLRRCLGSTNIIDSSHAALLRGLADVRS